MKNIVAINYLCLYALLEMILNDIGEMEWDQIRLANLFGLRLPKGEYIKDIENIEYSDDEHQYGAHIDVDALNSFFSKEHISLRASYISWNPYDCYDKAETDEASKYVVYLYSYGSLNNDLKKKEVGHASIKVSGVKNGLVSIYDPGPLDAGIKEVKLSKMYDAISDCRGGILILERI